MHGGGCPVPWPPHTCGGNIEIAATGQHCPSLKLAINYPNVAKTPISLTFLCPQTDRVVKSTGCGAPTHYTQGTGGAGVGGPTPDPWPRDPLVMSRQEMPTFKSGYGIQVWE